MAKDRHIFAVSGTISVFKKRGLLRAEMKTASNTSFLVPACIFLLRSNRNNTLTGLCKTEDAVSSQLIFNDFQTSAAVSKQYADSEGSVSAKLTTGLHIAYTVHISTYQHI